MTEESPVNPQTTYAVCKSLVERDVRPMADETFLPTFLCNATAYGASPRMRFDIVLNNLSGLAWTTNKIAMTSDGTPWRPLVHALDIGEAIRCVLGAPTDAARGEVFNVGSNEQNYQVREIAERVGTVFPGCELTFGERSADNRSYRVNFDKISARLPGFSCRWDAQKGAEQLREIFSRVDLNETSFTGRGHTRLKAARAPAADPADRRPALLEELKAAGPAPAPAPTSCVTSRHTCWIAPRSGPRLLRSRRRQRQPNCRTSRGHSDHGASNRPAVTRAGRRPPRSRPEQAADLCRARRGRRAGRPLGAGRSTPGLDGTTAREGRGAGASPSAAPAGTQRAGDRSPSWVSPRAPCRCGCVTSRLPSAPVRTRSGCPLWPSSAVRWCASLPRSVAGLRRWRQPRTWE